MARLTATFSSGHQLQLLQGAQALFPALITAVDGAQTEVLLETYIFDLSGAGQDVLTALMRAAQRGVRVQVTVDGVGTRSLAKDWSQRVSQSGVAWRVYAPLGALGLLVPNRWRRMHRKLAVVDGHTAFCGGINVLDDLHDPNYGALEAPRLDYAIQVSGPLVARAHEAMTQTWLRMRAVQQLRERQLSGAMAAYRASMQPPAPSGETTEASGARAALLLRDNLRNRSQIEKAYLQAIGAARREIVIANAYFLPGRKLRRALTTACKRGVRVQILLQGRYEYFMQFYASRSVYGELLGAGVEIHEYLPSFLHAKVAVVDGHWATVGSSNLDPLSLLLAREANVVVDDVAFAADLRERLLAAIAQQAKPVDAAGLASRTLRERIRERVALGLMRLALLITGFRY